MAGSKRNKIIRASEAAKAGILVENNAISISGSSENFVRVETNGTAIRGPMSMINMGPQRRVGGLWVNQMEILDMIPETLITPIPNIFPMPPMLALVNLGSDVGFFAGLIAF